MNNSGKIQLAPQSPGRASRTIDAANKRAEDPLKNWTPPQREECPICLLPQPLDESQITYQSCCGKSICCGCTWRGLKTRRMDASRQGMFRLSRQDLDRVTELAFTCPFCRTKVSSITDSEIAAREMKRAESGIAESMWYIGSYYFYGEMGFEQNKTEGLKWYRKAAEAGSIGATGSLGMCYQEGDGLEKDIVKGMHYLQKSAELGKVQAFWIVGYDKWKKGEIEDSILNFRKGAICGFDDCLDQILPFFRSGFITREEYAFTLREHQAASNEMKIEAREQSIIFLGQQGHTMLEGARLLHPGIP